MKDCFLRTDEYICDLRTVGVLVRDGKLLVQRDRDGSEYALPGGHVKIGETTADGLVREYKEETGADIKIGKLLWTEECFWEWNGTQAHMRMQNAVDMGIGGELASKNILMVLSTAHLKSINARLVASGKMTQEKTTL